MTEGDLKARYESDANADEGKAGLTPDEITNLVKDWFYTGGEFDSTLANPLTSRYCRAVAAGYRKRQGKADDPSKRLSQNMAGETDSHFRNLVTAERRWLEAADRFDEEARVAAAGSRSGASTSTVRGVPTF